MLPGVMFALSIHFLWGWPAWQRCVGTGLGMLHALCRYLAANPLVSKVNGKLPGRQVAAERVVDAAEPAAQIERTRTHVCVFACEFDRCQTSVRAGVNARRCPWARSNGGADVRMVP